MNPEPGSSKSQLREWAKTTRDALSPDHVSAVSTQVVEKLTTVLAPYECVGLYASFRNEIDLLGLTDAHPDIRFVLPRLLDAAQMEFAPIDAQSELKTNRFGIREPTGAAIEPDAIDAILVPGLVFDPQGGRIGFGGGYYDRFIERRHRSERPLFVIGIAMQWQIVERLPMDEFDQMMDSIITEETEYLTNFRGEV